MGGEDPDPGAGADADGAVLGAAASPEAALESCKGFTHVVSLVDEL